MKNLKSKLGFTLIELLVVITIIGILATGAVSVFTSQIQKARDSTRITSANALKSGIEQYYQDKDEYPEPSAFSGVTIYTPKLPIDPKTDQKSNLTSFEFSYATGPDTNGIKAQDYEVSVGFENSGNTTTKAAKDGGGNPNRLEIGIDLTGNNTRINGVQNSTSWASSTAATPAANSCIAAPANETVTTDLIANAACSDSTSTTQSSILVIR